jgi:hypothetical protein
MTVDCWPHGEISRTPSWSNSVVSSTLRGCHMREWEISLKSLKPLSNCRISVDDVDR